MLRLLTCFWLASSLALCADMVPVKATFLDASQSITERAKALRLLLSVVDGNEVLQLVSTGERARIVTSVTEIYRGGDTNAQVLALNAALVLGLPEAFRATASAAFQSPSDAVRGAALYAAPALGMPQDEYRAAAYAELRNSRRGEALSQAIRIAGAFREDEAIPLLAPWLSDAKFAPVAAEALSQFPSLPESVQPYLEAARVRAAQELNRLEVVYQQLPDARPKGQKNSAERFQAHIDAAIARIGLPKPLAATPPQPQTVSASNQSNGVGKALVDEATSTPARAATAPAAVPETSIKSSTAGIALQPPFWQNRWMLLPMGGLVVVLLLVFAWRRKHHPAT